MSLLCVFLPSLLFKLKQVHGLKESARLKETQCWINKEHKSHSMFAEQTVLCPRDKEKLKLGKGQKETIGHNSREQRERKKKNTRLAKRSLSRGPSVQLKADFRIKCRSSLVSTPQTSVSIPAHCGAGSPSLENPVSCGLGDLPAIQTEDGEQGRIRRRNFIP